MITVFGIKNCDTMKKAFRWLSDNNIEYRFHDFKKEGLDDATANAWISELGWENVINKRGTTWRKLDNETKNQMDNERAVHTIVSQPSLVKRPVLVYSGNIHLGFNPESYAQKLL